MNIFPGVALALLLIAQAIPARTSSPETVDEWVAEPGGQATTQADVLTLRRGAIRTTRLYSDFVLRLEFRLRAPDAEGGVFVRSWFRYNTGPGTERGYQVMLSNKLDGSEALGRLKSAQVSMEEKRFAPAQLRDVDGGWQALEVRAERDVLTVAINGQQVSSTANLDEFTGYITLQTRRGAGIEFRRVAAERLSSTGEPFGRDAYRAEDARITLPRLQKNVKPFYPQEPHDAWIQGTVGLQAVVDTTGRVGDIRVSRSLHPHLDEAAIGAARKWEFVPGTMSGQKVPVIVAIEISFRRTQ